MHPNRPPGKRSVGLYGASLIVRCSSAWAGCPRPTNRTSGRPFPSLSWENFVLNPPRECLNTRAIARRAGSCNSTDPPVKIGAVLVRSTPSSPPTPSSRSRRYLTLQFYWKCGEFYWKYGAGLVSLAEHHAAVCQYRYIAALRAGGEEPKRRALVPDRDS